MDEIEQEGMAAEKSTEGVVDPVEDCLNYAMSKKLSPEQMMMLSEKLEMASKPAEEMITDEVTEA